MRHPPLRWMILVPILAVVAVGLVALSVYVDQFVHRDLIEQVDEELVRAEQAGLLRRDPPGPDANGGDAPPNLQAERPRRSGETIAAPVELLVNSNGSVVEEGAQGNPFNEQELMALTELPSGQYTFSNVDYRVRTSQLPNGTVSVTALDLTGVELLRSNLRRALLIGSAVVLVLQAFIVWCIASYLSRPLRQMTESARRIANGQLERPIGTPGGSSETVALAVDLDQMLVQLRTTIAQSELSAEEARKACDQMERFLADASHELRTPLTAMKGYSDLYKGQMLNEPEDLDRAMGRIGSESERMHRLVKDMLTLSRSGEFEPAELTTVDVADIVTNLAADMGAAYPDSRIDIRCPPGIPPTLQGDDDQIHQALLNIVANAHHHTPPGSPIEIDVGHGADAVAIRIADHGAGIDADLAEKIFLPFYQADESRARTGDSGAGLGLAITKRIIDGHGGTVRLEDTPGGGATFIVELPTGAGPAPIEAHDSPLVASDG